MNVLDVLRICVGVVFVLFVPGFFWSYFFFAGKEIDWIERVALSLGLSLALVPISIFWLNQLFHVRITVLTVSATIVALVLLAILFLFFRMRISTIFRNRNRYPDDG
jgi:uncharacterized membrane protein